MKKFVLIGDGRIAKYHRKAIEHIEGEIIIVIDPKNGDEFPRNIFINKYRLYFDSADYFVICSPSNFHYSQIKFILDNISSWNPFQIICEKPAFLPWEPIINSDLINIVLQLRYLPSLPKKAEKVVAHFVRDEEYFKHWQGDPRKSGGLFFHLYIHFIDLAIHLGADFEGSISGSGKQKRFIETGPLGLDIIDLENIDNQLCYNFLYEAVLEGKGIKPKDIFYLMWTLARNSELFGYSRNSIGKTIKIGRELL